MSGDVFMMAPDSELHAGYARLAATRGFHIDPAHVQDVTQDELMRMILLPGGVQRFRGWLEDCEKGSLGGTLLFDVDHNCNTKGSTSGSEWPVNLRHGSIFAARQVKAGVWQWRMGCPFEYLAAMGFHMYPGMSGAWGVSPLRGILEQYSAGQIQSLAGNGMHLVTQSAFMLYVLGNTVVKDSAKISSSTRSGCDGGLGDSQVLRSQGSWEFHLQDDGCI